MNLRNITEEIIEIEAKTISLLKNSISDDLFDSIDRILHSEGRLVVSGIGKSALVGQKMVATFNSTGTPALFMHAADAVHGDLGMIGEKDIVLLISKSGESSEVKQLIPLIKRFGNKIIAMVAKPESYLAKEADYVLHTPIEREADPFDLIPTASTISQMAMGDVLAISLLRLRGFTRSHFANFHPGGMIGKSLLMQVKEICDKHESPSVGHSDQVEQVIVEISKKRMGATAVLKDSVLVGIITDGDLRRMMQKKLPLDTQAAQIMSPDPKTIEQDTLVTSALSMMRDQNISQLLVTHKGAYRGMIHLHDILKEGF